MWTYTPQSEELKHTGLKFEISATERINSMHTVQDIADDVILRMKVMKERTALAYKPESRKNVTDVFKCSQTKPLVNFDAASTVAVAIERPELDAIIPSKPELLKSGKIIFNHLIFIGFREQGLCYKILIQGEKDTVNKELANISAMLKTINFLYR